MATLSEIRQRVDDWLAGRWPTLVGRQEAYFANQGRYFQGFWTHTSTPADGADAAADNLAMRPSDQAARWPDLLTLPDLLPCALRIDVYEHPSGHGWVATLRVQVAGTVYERRGQVGPETWRSAGWREVVELQEGV
jgi:hypothetical protein